MVVFDGWKGGSNLETSSIMGGVKVVYSRLGEKADSVIKRIISSERREWIVVSSDREVAAHAWATGSVPIPSEEFLPCIEEAASGFPPFTHCQEPVKDEEDEEGYGFRKGNPRRRSKKEKAIERALGKL